MDRSASGGPQGPQPALVDQEHSGPPWTTLPHLPNISIFPDVSYSAPLVRVGFLILRGWSAVGLVPERL